MRYNDAQSVSKRLLISLFFVLFFVVVVFFSL